MRVLFVEDSAADARLIREQMRDQRPWPIDLVRVPLLSDALRRLRFESFDAVLLDLGLPDARGLEALQRVQELGTDVPVVVFSGHRDEAQAVEAVRSGAQDYILKDHLDPAHLARALRYACERKRAELQIHHMAYHDGLTDLPNRRLFSDRLNRELAHARRQKQMLAIVFLDLDDFKTINDTLGHAEGDRLLREIASRLSHHLREGDTVARLGGDEFALLLPEISDVDAVHRIAAKVQWSLVPPFHLAGQEHYVTASLGVSLFPNDGQTAEALLRCADAAMYQAKRRGPNNCQFYSTAPETQPSDRLALRNGLRRALEAGEFVLHYQPRVDAHTREILGAEALLRWRHPTWGLLAPGRFVPLAEEMGLIVPIGRWVLARACAQGQRWNAARPGRPLQISVNLSSREFGSKELQGSVRQALEATGFPAAQLELELTESGFTRDWETTNESLRRLNQMGVRISIDDFGTGYSSLERLRRFAINALKIDSSFVRDLSFDRSDAAIVTAIISMAHGLNLRVIAEGVETAEQMTELSDHGCDELQGFYFGAPQPPEALEPTLVGGSS